MNNKSAWVKDFFDRQFPLLNEDIREKEAEDILCSQKPDKLYKYRQADENGFSVLEKGELWLARADTLNDKFDCFYAYSTKDIIDSLEQGLRKKNPNVSSDTVCSLRTNTRGDIEDTHNRHRECFRQGIKLCSLSERPDIGKMWEAYSDKHTGFCVEFDIQKLGCEIFKNLFPVLYSDARVDFSPYIIKGCSNPSNVNPHFIRRAALTKSLDWAYEEEWRLMTPDDKEKRGVICTGMPISCVYIGREASEDTRRRIHSVCDRNNIPIK